MNIKTALTLLLILLVLFLIGCNTKTIVIEPDNTDLAPDTVIDTAAEDADTADTADTGASVDTAGSADIDSAGTGIITKNVTAVIPETTHTIEVRDDGFEPDKLTINIGDTIIWKNVREDRFTEAFIIGTQGVCKDMTSKDTFPPKGFFNPGEEYSYTFEEAGQCTYVDAILTTIQGKITVE